MSLETKPQRGQDQDAGDNNGHGESHQVDQVFGGFFNKSNVNLSVADLQNLHRSFDAGSQR